MLSRNFAIALLMAVTSLSAGTPDMSFKKGFPISHVQFLLPARGSIVPTVSLGYFGLSNKYESQENDTNYDYSSTSKTSVHLFMPKVGLRKFGQPSGDLRTYSLAEVFYLLPMIARERDGEEISDEQKKEFRDALDVLGLTVGYGVEYKFSDQFSVGSEVAFNMIYHSTHDESDGDSSYTFSRDTRTILGGLLTSFTMNYYFN